jgi:2-polyprenyl-3-methyl-5-hydroxy-6-metoxy-1,4-benzoquinol methylase
MKYSAGFPHISRTQCKACKLVFANPMATADELNAFYANYYEKGNFEALAYKNKTSELFKQIDSIDSTELKSLSQFDKNVVKYAPNGNFLDIGFGLGFQLYLANKCGATTVYGTELDADAIQFVKSYLPNANLFEGELISAKYDDNYFDTINLCHVIEHVLNPVEYMNEVYRITKKGGVLILATPNIAAFPYKLFRVFNFLSFKVPVIVDGLEHTFIFSMKNLRALAESVGYKVKAHYSEAVKDSFQNIFKSNLSFRKKCVRYIQTKLKINQVLVLVK